MSLKSVKTKIKSIDKTRQVTKAMEAVSAVKMRKSQQTALSTRPYALAAFKVLRSIMGAVDLLNHPLMKQKDTHRVCIIVVSADKGLAGSYGSNLLKGVYKFMEREAIRKDDLDLIIVGRKAREHFEKRGYHVIAHYEQWSDKIMFDNVRPIADLVRDEFVKCTYGHVYVVSTHFISTLKQEVRARMLLPLNFVAIEEAIRGITPETGRYAELRADVAKAEAPTPGITLEPSPEEIVRELMPLLFNIQIYHAVLEANASEHSARMIAMKNASDNARDIAKTLKLRYNKVRQSAITKEVSEIVGGMESMKIAE